MPERTAWLPTPVEIAVMLGIALILTSTSIPPVPWWAPGAAWLAVVAVTIVVTMARATLQRRRAARPSKRQAQAA